VGIKEPSEAFLFTWAGLVTSPASRSRISRSIPLRPPLPPCRHGWDCRSSEHSPDEVYALWCGDDTRKKRHRPHHNYCGFLKIHRQLGVGIGLNGPGYCNIYELFLNFCNSSFAKGRVIEGSPHQSRVFAAMVVPMPDFACLCKRESLVQPYCRLVRGADLEVDFARPRSQTLQGFLEQCCPDSLPPVLRRYRH